MMQRNGCKNFFFEGKVYRSRIYEGVKKVFLGNSFSLPQIQLLFFPETATDSTSILYLSAFYIPYFSPDEKYFFSLVKVSFG
jgi:hypothetical protein